MPLARTRALRVPWRLRVLLVTVPAIALLAAALAVAPDPDAPAAVSTTPAELSPCQPLPAATTVDQLNLFVGALRGSGEFEGADVGADTTLQDGRRLWVFGDTLRSRDYDGQRFVRNSMLLFDPACVRVVTPADRGALVPDRKDGVGYWPMSVASIPRDGYDLVGVGLQRVKGSDAPDGPQAFDNLGPSFALFIVRRGGTPQLVDVEDFGRDSSDPSRPTWGAAAAVHDGWVYLYGTARPRDAAKKLVFGFSLRVARVRPDDITDTSRWQYWNGTRWQGSASDAVQLIDAEGGVSQTLSVFEQDGRWFAVSKRDEFLGSDLVIWSAPSPTGPFTASAPLASIPSDAGTGALRYMPLAHPDLLPEPGTVVVSYSQNNTDLAKVADDPFLYRPRFLRVRLPDVP
ncbi:MAG: DUF4185 domain-containing protein [Actinomycetales bacterium]|nr:MAG: DUF4185 domain-containing protein [Actinomycetales bacterium]